MKKAATVEHVDWLLDALARRSPESRNEMKPGDTIDVDLSLDAMAIRSLTNSMRVHIKESNSEASLARKEVEKASTVRGELQLIVKKIDDSKLSDEDADEALDEAQGEE